ncbi:MAG: MaoC/PaaZ C-terminal domain-containing protein [Dehalococcoidia bacterium]|nr:MaoC/PaaZ C-terminal domain-containing protein [Dehalococcoidia bacterium]MDD5495083.1 MaoC/PaaZ C-terminal domain-containing protein [Dehalococcoidia bacterium]
MKKQLYWEDVNIGQEIPPLTKVATTLALVKWAGAFGDYNPLHYDNDFAVNFMKTGGVIAHGTLKRQWLIQMLTDWIGDEGWLKRIQTQFRIMDYPRRMKTLVEPEDGDTLTCKGKVTAKSEKGGEHLVECEIWLENGKGEITTGGSATVMLPAKK